MREWYVRGPNAQRGARVDFQRDGLIIRADRRNCGLLVARRFPQAVVRSPVR